MRVNTFQYRRGCWNTPLDSSLDSPSTLVLVFGGSEYLDQPAAIEAVATAFPDSHLVGCSSSGEILGASIHDSTLTVAVARFEHTRIAIAQTDIASVADSHEAGVSLSRQLVGPELCAVFVLSDGLAVNGSELSRGLNAELPPSVVVTGGLAGDGSRFQRTWVLENRRPRAGMVTAVGFYGPSLRVGHGSMGGWDIFGPERRVTRSNGNILLELDGKPALELYKTYLGERASGLPATALLFPLSVRRDVDNEPSLVRTVLAVDEADQSMTFAGDIPQGAFARLMRANFDRLVEGAAGAAVRAKRTDTSAGPTLAIAISCVGRRLVLGERTEEEVEATLEVLPPGTTQVGFYSYGEISPYASGKCDLHNQTMTLTTFHEVV